MGELAPRPGQLAVRFLCQINPLRRVGTKVHPQGQDAIDQFGVGISDHGEILIVELGLANELRSFVAPYRGKIPTFHRFGSFAESDQHLVYIKAVRHRASLAVLRNRRPGVTVVVGSIRV